MTEQFLDGPDIGTAFEKMSREAVAQRMAAHFFLQARSEDRVAHHFLQ